MGTNMDHMTFTTIFSLLTTAGMVLAIMWGMSIVDLSCHPICCAKFVLKVIRVHEN
jgi:hypothetical protein